MKSSVEIWSGPFESEGNGNLAVVSLEGHVLMGTKTRGYGAGRLVFPGGKDRYYVADDGIHTMSDNSDATRELREETGVYELKTPLHQMGNLLIDTEDDLKEVGVFVGEAATPVINDSEELFAVAWYPTDKIPYAKTPEDYRFWLPHILDGAVVTMFLETHYDELLGGSVNVMDPTHQERSQLIPIEL